jgi:hypothetical protein
MTTRRPRPSGWTIAWVLWLLVFLAIEIPAALREAPGTVKTLSRHVWARWCPRWWQRLLVVAFGVEVFVLHFADSGRHWWSGGEAVVLTGAPVAALVVWRERAMFGKVWKVLKAVGSKAGAGINWTLRHGSKVAGLLGGAAIGATALGHPGIAAALKVGASMLGGAAGVDGELVQTAGALIGATVVVASVLRKYYLDAKPLVAKLLADLKAGE